MSIKYFFSDKKYTEKQLISRIDELSSEACFSNFFDLYEPNCYMYLALGQNKEVLQKAVDLINETSDYAIVKIISEQSFSKPERYNWTSNTDKYTIMQIKIDSVNDAHRMVGFYMVGMVLRDFVPEEVYDKSLNFSKLPEKIDWKYFHHKVDPFITIGHTIWSMYSYRIGRDNYSSYYSNVDYGKRVVLGDLSDIVYNTIFTKKGLTSFFRKVGYTFSRTLSISDSQIHCKDTDLTPALESEGDEKDYTECEFSNTGFCFKVLEFLFPSLRKLSNPTLNDFNEELERLSKNLCTIK